MKKITLGCWSILVFVGVLSLGISPAGAADVVVAFGDSITYGEGSTPYSSYLQTKLGGKATVVNRGKPGEQTGNGAKRISSVLAADKPKYILIMEGANDAIWGVSTSTLKFNIGVMIDKSKAAGAIPIVGNVTPNSRDRLTVSIRSDYNPGIAAVAAAKGATLVDAFGAVEKNWANLTYDGLHPNPAGSSLLADTFYPALPYGSSGGGGGGCFIATAAFGSELAEKVVLLKEFRDRFLMTNAPGKSFVRMYYHYSPPVAEFIARHDFLRAVVRALLYPLIGVAYLLLHASLPVRLLLIGGVALSLGYTAHRAYRARSAKFA